MTRRSAPRAVTGVCAHPGPRVDPAAPDPDGLPDARHAARQATLGPPPAPGPRASEHQRAAYRRELLAWQDSWALSHLHLTGLFAD